MRDGLITQTDACATSVTLMVNRGTIDRLPGDAIFPNVKLLATPAAGHPRLVGRVRLFSEVR